MKMELNINNLPKNADWLGNNAAFTCPSCKKVFLVSSFPPQNGGKRDCPCCGLCMAFCKEDRAYIECKVEEKQGFWKQKVEMPWWQILIAGLGSNAIARTSLRSDHIIVAMIFGVFGAPLVVLGIWEGVKKMYRKFH